MTIYLDHNATSPLDGRVRDAMLPFLDCGNPSSVHRAGRKARNAIEQAREQLAAWLAVQPAQVIFTSGGTEANNHALWGVAQTMARPGRILVSAVEHSSVLEPAQALQQAGWDLKVIPVDGNGRVVTDALPELIENRPSICSVMAANNETGALQPIAEIAAQARSQGVIFHTDAVQWAGKLPLRFSGMGAHLMSLSAHKLNGPKGIGALIVDKTLDIAPLLRGGGQERGLRSGTENVAAIVGFGCAAALADKEQSARSVKTQELRDYFIARLGEFPRSEVLSSGAERLPNTVMFTLPGIEGETTLLHLDGEGIAISSGSACHSGRTDPSHVLVAMAVERNTAFSAVRVSFGAGNTRTDVDVLIAALQSLYRRMAPFMLEQPAGSSVKRI